LKEAEDMFGFTVEPDGAEPYEIKASVRDVRQWEKATGKTVSDLSAGSVDLADAYLLAYHASVRMGKFKGTLDEFEATVDFEMPQMEEAPLASSQEA
jgi:hypothetical protein